MGLQYRSVAILAGASALATLFYLSVSPNVDQDEAVGYRSTHPHFRPAAPPLSSSSSSLSSSNHQSNKRPTNQERLPHQQPGKLVSDNNARVTALNSKAFIAFCNSKGSEDRHGSTISETSFASYDEWIAYINNNSDDIGGRPKFLERPLQNWIVNLTATKEPCDRRVHTSAHCLEFLSKEHEYLTPLPASSSSKSTMDFHIFWRGPITDKLSLSAHSFLFTQPLDRARLHLWIDSADLPEGLPEDYTKNKFAAPLVSEPLSRFITIHSWDQAAELSYSYSYGNQLSYEEQSDVEEEPIQTKILEVEQLEQALRSLSSSQQPAKPVALSDEARFLILNRNGGIYLDADVLLLKDMSPFFDAGVEFAYEWSNTQMYNTAIMRLFPGSSVARRILEGAKNRELEILQKKLKEQQVRQQQETDDVEFAAAREEDEEEDDTEAEAEAADDRETGREKEGSAAREQPARKHKLDFLRQPKAHTKKTKILKTVLSKRGEMRPEEIYHPARLRAYLQPKDSKLEGNGLIMMPPAFFDPLWLRVDGAETKSSTDADRMVEDLHSFPDAFSVVDAVCPAQSSSESGAQGDDFSAGPEVFFTGAYAYHWHNNWLTPIKPNSWMGLMRQAYDDFVEGRRLNLYGESFTDAL